MSRELSLLVLLYSAMMVGCHQLDSILDESYDARIRPKARANGDLIQVQMRILDVKLQGENEMRMSLELGESWLDPRLGKNFPHDPDSKTGAKDEILDKSSSTRIWSPQTTIKGSQEFNSFGTPNIIIKLNSDGQVLKWTRMTVIVGCGLNLFYFPFDGHKCAVELQNLEYTDQDLIYSWKDVSLEIGSGVTETSLLALEGYRISNSSSEDEMFCTGKHSTLRVEVYLKRKAARSFPLFYFPAIVLTLMAFGSLWVPSTPFSISVALANLFGMILYYIGIQALQPAHFEMGMLDHYHFLCLNLILNCVFVTAIQYKIQSTSLKSSPKVDNSKIEMNGEYKDGDVEDNRSSPSRETPDLEAPIYQMSKFKHLVYYKGCKPAKYHLPIGFLFINVIYWIWILIATFPFPSGFERV